MRNAVFAAVYWLLYSDCSMSSGKDFGLGFADFEVSLISCSLRVWIKVEKYLEKITPKAEICRQEGVRG